MPAKILCCAVLFVIALSACATSAPANASAAPASPAELKATEAEPAAVHAVHTAAERKPFIRFTPQGTSFCARMPDGTFRHVVYGVGGGTDGFVILRATNIGVSRDISCSDYGVQGLGARGVVSYFDDRRGLHAETVRPGARALRTIPGAVCIIDERDVVRCTQRPYPIDTAKFGPVAAFASDDCVLFQDGRVACHVNGASGPPFLPWERVAQASVAGGIGCAVLPSGQVSCYGDNELQQRGFIGLVDRGAPTLVPKLDGVAEVHVSGAHACARRGGEVWCWGRSDGGQAGRRARDEGTPWPRCERDHERTARAKQELAEAQALCRGERGERGPVPKQDDPFCRSVHGAYVTDFYKERVDKQPCDPAGAVKHAGPTRIDGIDDAVALGVRGGMSCALRANNAIVCWGGGAKGLREFAVSQEPPTVEPDAGVALPPAGPSIVVHDKAVLVRGGERPVLHELRGTGVRRGEMLDADDAAFTYYGLCLLKDGVVDCPGSPKASIRTMFGGARFSGGCLLSHEAGLACYEQGGRYGAMLTVLGAIEESQGLCARYVDGRVRCVKALHSGAEMAEPFGDARVRSMSLPLWPLHGCVVVDDGGVLCAKDSAPANSAPANSAPANNAPPATSALATSSGPEVWRITGLPTRARLIAGDHQRMCALVDDGSVWCWRKGSVPARIRSALSDALAFGIGGDVGCVLRGSGALECFGLPSTTP
jgi:hypothetical protein